MRIHDVGPRGEVAYPAAKETAWTEDYCKRGFVERDRPYLDDDPTLQRGGESRSRWGSRPVREFGRDFEPGGTLKSIFRLAWRRVRRALRGG